MIGAKILTDGLRRLRYGTGSHLANGAWCPLLFCSALLLGIAGRAVGGWSWPFWFDETFSGVIASQPTMRGLVDWSLHELTGPGYYWPLWAWEKIAGSSDTALRLPSLACSLAAPLVIYWKGHPNRQVRALWGSLAVLWLPGLGMASEARPYAVLFLYATIQAIAFLRMMRQPNVGNALVWTSISALMILTNYFSLFICGVQGIIYLAVHRKAAVATFPALLPLLPAAAWSAVHSAFVMGYANSPAAWYKVLPLSAVALVPLYIFGSKLHGTIVLGAIAWTGVGFARRRRAAKSASSARQYTFSPEIALVCAAVVACTAFFILAFIRPTFVARYLTSMIPGLLFGIAWWANAMLRRRRIAPVLVVFAMFAIMVIGGMKNSLFNSRNDVRFVFNFEQPSSWLMESHPKQVVFFWDSPTGAYVAPHRLAEAGGFFFRRGGQTVSVVSARIPQSADTNAAMLRLANAQPETVILWIATDPLNPVRAPRVEAYDKRWECRDFGSTNTIVNACKRR